MTLTLIPQSNDLHVIVGITNATRLRARPKLLIEFSRRAVVAGIQLWIAEVAFGQRPHVVTEAGNPRHLQLRSRHELWHKENLLNLLIQRLPTDWKYVAWIDPDVQFTHPNWAEETIEQLQHYDIVQMFSHAVDLSPHYEPMKTHSGFVHDWYHHPKRVQAGGYATFSHPGYAWAATREAIDGLGGLIEHGILGSGDRHMACSLIGKAAHSYHAGVHQRYKDRVLAWEERARRVIRGNIGYVPGTINHYWHGSKADRGYTDRWKLLVEHQFNPDTDVYRDAQGLLQLHPHATGLRDSIRRYMRSRFEDSDWTGGPHKMGA